MKAQQNLIDKRVFSDIPNATVKAILTELRAGRSVVGTARMFDMNDKFVTRIRNDAGIPVKRDGKGTNKTPDTLT